jgi:8-oxo-dGTP diphosphatase
MKYCVHFIFKDEQILLLKRKDSNPFYPGIWTPIIGKLKKEEDPFKAVVRETIEETQLKIDNPNFIKQCEFDNDQYWFFHSSIVTDDIILNHENDQFDFFEKTELPQNLWSFFKTVLDEI